MATTAGSRLTVLDYDLEIPARADWPGVAFPIYNPDGSLANLTDCSARGAIRPDPHSSELYFAWSSTPTGSEGTITISVQDSTITPRVLATESALWRFTNATYDLVLVNPSAPVGMRTTRVVMGRIVVSAQNTP